MQLLLLQLDGFRLCPDWRFHTPFLYCSIIPPTSGLGFQLALFIGQSFRIRQVGGFPFIDKLRNGGIDVALKPFENFPDPFWWLVIGQGSRNGVFHPRQYNGGIGQLFFGSLGRDRYRPEAYFWRTGVRTGPVSDRRIMLPGLSS